MNFLFALLLEPAPYYSELASRGDSGITNIKQVSIRVVAVGIDILLLIMSSEMQAKVRQWAKEWTKNLMKIVALKHLQKLSK